MACHITQQSASSAAIWGKLAVQTGEMLSASQQVIGYRIGRMAVGAGLNAQDQSEFAVMGQEKIDAATQSAQAMTVRAIDEYMKMGTLVWEQMLSQACDMLPADREGFSVMNQWPGQVMANMASHSGQVLVQWADAAANVMQDGLQPIHARATGNARRLCATDAL